MRGQGSLEYLLILAAVLAIAVVVILVANNIMNPARTGASIQMDKYSCSLEGIELLNYNSPYLGTRETAPGQIKPCETCSPLSLSGSSSQGLGNCLKSASCKLQKKYNLTVCFSNGQWSAYLENASGGYFVYGQPASSGGGGREIIYASGWSGQASKDAREICGNSDVYNYLRLNPSAKYELKFDNKVSGKYNIHIYVRSGSPDNLRVNGVKCKGYTTHVAFCSVNCSPQCTLEVESNQYVSFCVGNTTGSYCDWANETCDCSSVDYCYPPYLEKVNQ